MNGILSSIIVLIITFIIAVLLDVFGQRRFMKHAVIAGLLVSLLALLSESGYVSSLVKFDLFTQYFAIIAILVALLVILASHESTVVYYGSILLSTIGMILAAATNDLILLYISIELVTVPTYILVAYHRTAKRIEAGVKYFVVSIVGSALMLLGLALLSADGTNISVMTFQMTPLFTLGIVAFIAGMGFKLGIFPFNFWIPDVYEGAPAPITGLLAGASKKAAYAAFLRVAVVIAALHNWGMVFAILAALTMTVPNLIALMQPNVKRLLAYSIMSHAGFLLLGLTVASTVGYAALLFHSFAHAFMTLGAFLVLGVFNSHNIETIDQFKGIGWRNKFLGFALTIFLLSLAGIPLLVGFASKLYLFFATVEGGYLWLAVLAIVNSVISLYYYFKVIRAMYAYPGGGHPFRMRPGTVAAIVICLVIVVLAGVYPQPFIRFAHAAVEALF